MNMFCFVFPKMEQPSQGKLATYDFFKSENCLDMLKYLESIYHRHVNIMTLPSSKISRIAWYLGKVVGNSKIIHGNRVVYRNPEKESDHLRTYFENVPPHFWIGLYQNYATVCIGICEYMCHPPWLTRKRMLFSQALQVGDR